MNKTFLKFALLMVGVAALSGCDIDGTLVTKSSVNLIDKKGRQVSIVAGQSYRTELAKDGDKVKFNIEINGKERELRLPPPPGTKLPKYNGNLMIPASTSGQPVDFYGVVDTKDYDGHDQRGSQSCVTQAQARVCQQVPTARPGQTEERCSFELRTVSGSQETVYHDHQSVTSATVQLLVPNSQNEVAHFEGSHTESSTVTTWTGRCETAYDDQRGPGGPRGPGPGRGGPHPR